MTARLKWLLLAMVISMSIWGGLIAGGVWMLRDGTDGTVTASPH